MPNKADQFDDPLAVKAAWSPLAGGGASFCSHRLVQARPGRMVFRPTRGAKAFAGIFLGVGVLVLAAMVRSIGRESWGLLIVLLLAGAAFVAMGVLVLRKLGRPATFDLLLGFYWKGRRKPTHALSESPPSRSPASARKRGRQADRRRRGGVNLDDVHALQIVSEEHEAESTSERSDRQRRSYRSYELNLILTDAARVNVIDHGNADALRHDAETLAAFLNIPLWDAG